MVLRNSLSAIGVWYKYYALRDGGDGSEVQSTEAWPSALTISSRRSNNVLFSGLGNHSIHTVHTHASNKNIHIK